jgi:hypothetical protein
MEYRALSLIMIFMGILAFGLNGEAQAMTAHEILDKSLQQNFGDSFRVALDLTTQKSKDKVVKHSFWFIAKQSKDKSSYLVDFEQPEESKGLRFLFIVRKSDKPETYMYLPASQKTVPLSVDDASSDLGGTGLNMEDLKAFVPEGSKDASIVKEEKIDGRDCYVIKVPVIGGKGDRLLWMSKDGLLCVKSQHVAPDGKVMREFRVVEFFKTDQGKEFPREEEITIPEKKIKMRLRQENAVFGLEIPDELMDPGKFGIFRWKL